MANFSANASPAAGGLVAPAAESRWRTRDIVVAAVIGVAFGVVFWAWGLAWAGFEPLNGIFPVARDLLYAVWLGPVMICAGAAVGMWRLLRTGLILSFGAIDAMADIGVRSVVPGANDNLSAVGVLLGLAATLRERPVEGLRVLLLSTGSEESFSEGMQAFGDRHFAELDRARTEMLCLECLGSEKLIVLEGEGMLRMRDYTPRMREALAEAARRAGVRIGRGLRTVGASDALIALRAGYPTVTLASVEDTKLPLNYHWPSDVPQALHWKTIEDAIAVCMQLVHERAPGSE